METNVSRGDHVGKRDTESFRMKKNRDSFSTEVTTTATDDIGCKRRHRRLQRYCKWVTVGTVLPSK